MLELQQKQQQQPVKCDNIKIFRKISPYSDFYFSSFDSIEWHKKVKMTSSFFCSPRSTKRIENYIASIGINILTSQFTWAKNFAINVPKYFILVLCSLNWDGLNDAYWKEKSRAKLLYGQLGLWFQVDAVSSKWNDWMVHVGNRRDLSSTENIWVFLKRFTSSFLMSFFFPHFNKAEQDRKVKDIIFLFFKNKQSSTVQSKWKKEEF